MHGQVVEAIGTRIIDGHYRPGALLYPDKLEHEFGVSKTALREALKVLATKGLIDSRQKRGTVVCERKSWRLLDADLLRWQGRQPDAAFLQNLAEVRTIVEPAGAKLAATRHTEDDLAELEAALDAMEAAGTEPEALIAADLRFHRALLDAAHNELLSQMGVVLETALRIRDEMVHYGDDWPDRIPEHRALVDAVRSGDPVTAQQVMEEFLAQMNTDAAAIRKARAAKGAKS